MAAKTLLAEVATVQQHTLEIGEQKIPATVLDFSSYGGFRQFAELADGWHEVCGRCGGTGRLREYGHYLGGVCFGCGGTSGVRGASFDTRTEVEDAMRKWGMQRRTADRRQQERIAKAAAAREAALKVWADQHADLIAWCASLTPDSVEEWTESRVAVEATREAAETLWEDEFLIRSTQLTEGPEAGSWWASIGRTMRKEHFGSYGHKPGFLIADIRAGEVLQAKHAALVTSVMKRVTAAQATNRYAADLDEKVTVTGLAKVAKVCDGGRFGSKMFIIIEGTGEHAGITIKASTRAKSAWDVERGDLVTVTGVVDVLEERGGIKQTELYRPKFTVIEEAPVEGEDSTQEAPVEPQAPEATPKATEAVTEAQEAVEAVEEPKETPTPAAPRPTKPVKPAATARAQAVSVCLTRALKDTGIRRSEVVGYTVSQASPDVVEVQWHGQDGDTLTRIGQELSARWDVEHTTTRQGIQSSFAVPVLRVRPGTPLAAVEGDLAAEEDVRGAYAVRAPWESVRTVPEVSSAAEVLDMIARVRAEYGEATVDRATGVIRLHVGKARAEVHTLSPASEEELTVQRVRCERGVEHWEGQAASSKAEAQRLEAALETEGEERRHLAESRVRQTRARAEGARVKAQEVRVRLAALGGPVD